MNQLTAKIGNMNISEFKKGEMITRTAPALIKDPIGRGMQLFYQDYSFIGNQIEF